MTACTTTTTHSAQTEHFPRENGPILPYETARLGKQDYAEPRVSPTSLSMNASDRIKTSVAPGEHEPIIPRALFEAVQQTLAAKARKG